jgi:hypothetical protein
MEHWGSFEQRSGEKWEKGVSKMFWKFIKALFTIEPNDFEDSDL